MLMPVGLHSSAEPGASVCTHDSTYFSLDVKNQMYQV
jgi:hypothetical protein